MKEIQKKCILILYSVEEEDNYSRFSSTLNSIFS
jgi:hypothetical protein